MFNKYWEWILGVLYGKREFENKKDKISSQEKILIKVVFNAGIENADI